MALPDVFYPYLKDERHWTAQMPLEYCTMYHYIECISPIWDVWMSPPKDVNFFQALWIQDKRNEEPLPLDLGLDSFIQYLKQWYMSASVEFYPIYEQNAVTVFWALQTPLRLFVLSNLRHLMKETALSRLPILFMKGEGIIQKVIQNRSLKNMRKLKCYSESYSGEI